MRIDHHNLFEQPEALAAPHAPYSPLRRLALDLVYGAAFGLGVAALVFAWAWLSRDPARDLWFAVNKDFTTLVALCAAFGGAALAYCGAMWRYSRRRAMPWLVAALALWFAAEWALGLGPASANVFDDPRRDIAMGAFIAEGVLMMNAILGFMDGRIDNESMTPRAREQAGEER